MKKRTLSIAAAAAIFFLLLWKAPLVRQGAAEGLRLWTELLIPSLLPYFAAVGLMNRLGFTEVLGRFLAPAAARLFGISGAGASVFVLGLSGGYPLGSSTAAELVSQGRLDRSEAEHILAFADNTGPAFAVGALGLGVFRSSSWGLFLWGIHALAAVFTGILLSGRKKALPADTAPDKEPEPSFGEAFTDGVSGAVKALLSIGGFVIFFCALMPLAEAMAERLPLPGFLSSDLFRALWRGSLELSSGIGAMSGLPVTPGTLALAAFILGWGGLCVHLQAMAVTAPARLSLRKRFRGKLLHALLSAVLAWAFSSLLI